MGKQLISIIDDKGNAVPLRHAAELIPGMTYYKLAHYVKKYEAKTLDDVRIIIKDLKAHGRNCYAPKKRFETPYGMLTSREVWEMHPYKDTVSINNIRCRLSTSGGMTEKLWLPLVRDQRKKILIICGKCKRKLNGRQFETMANKKKHEHCFRCRGLAKKKNTMDVKPGAIVTSGGKRYEVAEVLEADGKPLVTGFLIMGNGQVLRNTVKYLATNWSLGG